MMKDYHGLYLKCDVLLLADIFEKFRKNSSKNYGLCTSHYLSTRALIWDAMLNIKKVKLELISDLCMYILFEKDMRGGVSYVSNRYSKASNKYLKTYDPKQEFKHLIYLNANNLYGYIITYFFPTSGFKWVYPRQFYSSKYTSNSSKVFALEVDYEYPEELREWHNDYPLALDKIEIKREMFPDYQLKIADPYNITIGNVENLIN